MKQSWTNNSTAYDDLYHLKTEHDEKKKTSSTSHSAVKYSNRIFDKIRGVGHCEKCIFYSKNAIAIDDSVALIH